MTWQLFLSLLAFLGVIVGLLFLSMIHLFMIPKDVMDRDTGKLRDPALQDNDASNPNESSDAMIAMAADPTESPAADTTEKPEVPEKPEPKPEQLPAAAPDSKPEPEIERGPGQQNDPDPEKEPGRHH